jgi:hypothetical protein
MEAIEEAQSMDRHSVRDRAAEEFDTGRMVSSLVEALVVDVGARFSAAS